MKNVTYNIIDWLNGGYYIIGYDDNGEVMWSLSNGGRVVVGVAVAVCFACLLVMLRIVI